MSSAKKRTPKPSKVERAKQGSDLLRGTVPEVLDSDAEKFAHDDIQVLKFHGIYQQDDRDLRTVRRATGLDKEYSFMVRAKIPGGVLTADQYLALDDVAQRFSNHGGLRVTTRQGIQYHGILKGNLRSTLRDMNDALVSTLAACGDVERNVMASPAPVRSPAHDALRQLADDIAEELCPRTRAYHSIWLDGEKIHTETADRDGEEEPFYGETYLPRKFKTAVALPEDNCVDLHSQDVGLLAVVEDGELRGVNILVGGGLGMTHRKEDTFARLGTPLGFVGAPHAARAVKTIAAIFRDHGNRSDRRHARLKYLIEDWGEEKFKQELQDRADFPLEPWRDTGPLNFEDHLGAHEQRDGRHFYGVWIQNGRIVDTPDDRTQSALRTIVELVRPGVVLTPNQNLLLTDLSEEDVEKVDKLLEGFNVRRKETLSTVRRHSMACPALPTCGLALSDAERALPGVIDELERELESLGLAAGELTVRMTGCPNGCARPYTADIGLVGRAPGFYDVYVGGRLAGDRLADFFAEQVAEGELVDTLRPLLEAWGRDRQDGEGLGDFYQRVSGNGHGPGHRTILTGSKEDPVRGRLEERLVQLAGV